LNTYGSISDSDSDNENDEVLSEEDETQRYNEENLDEVQENNKEEDKDEVQENKEEDKDEVQENTNQTRKSFVEKTTQTKLTNSTNKKINTSDYDEVQSGNKEENKIQSFYSLIAKTNYKTKEYKVLKTNYTEYKKLIKSIKSSNYSDEKLRRIRIKEEKFENQPEFFIKFTRLDGQNKAIDISKKINLENIKNIRCSTNYSFNNKNKDLQLNINLFGNIALTLDISKQENNKNPINIKNIHLSIKNKKDEYVTLNHNELSKKSLQKLNNYINKIDFNLALNLNAINKKEDFIIQNDFIKGHLLNLINSKREKEKMSRGLY
jgi:hypothetical protein